MGDRVVVLHKGVVRQIGTPKQVYDDPADTFVATFLGSPPMNLLENGDAIVGFRPEHLVPAAQAPSAAIKLKLKISNIEYLGSEWIVYGKAVDTPGKPVDGPGKIEAGQTPDKTIISRLPNADLTIGDTHDFAVAEPHLRFFDKKTEKRAPARALSWP
jgi:multiple sugar transport system ATP-binding protein